MEKVDEDLLQSIEDVFTKPSKVQIAKEDLSKFKEYAKAIYYSEYLADDEYKSVRISERIKNDLAKFASDNKAALYFVGDPDMGEVAEILDGLHVKTNEMIWGSYEDGNVSIGELKVALLFYEKKDI